MNTTAADGSAASTGRRIRPLRDVERDVVATLWNEALGDWHPLGTRGLERWWSPPGDREAIALLAEEDGVGVGVALARAPDRAWSPAGLGHLSLLAVAPHAQGRGIGSALWSAAQGELAARGRTVMRLGTEPGHLLPGVPVVVPERTWRFLRGRGVRFGGLEADLVLDLRGGAPAPDRPSVRVVHDPHEVVLRVRSWFPGRWAEEVERAAEGGVHLLAARDGARTVGFAVASLPDDAVLGPGLVWSQALAGRVAGLGPLGVDPELRGRGLGSALVAAAARWHAERGVDAVVFDWTSLASFYGRLGARAHRVYQRAEVAIGDP